MLYSLDQSTTLNSHIAIDLDKQGNNKAYVHAKNIDYQNFKLLNNKNISHIDWSFYSLPYPSAGWCCHGYKDCFTKKLFKHAN